jgi:hypothetical protein
MSIFDDVNFDEGTDNPFGLDPGTYEVSISDATIERSAKENLGLWLTFSNDEGKSIRKWTTMPEKDQEDDVRKRNTSFLRLLLRNLEIPEERWGSLTPEDFIGIDCVIVVTPQSNNPEYNQVKKITRSRAKSRYSTDSSTVYGDDSGGLAEFMKKGGDDVPAGGGIGF